MASSPSCVPFSAQTACTVALDVSSWEPKSPSDVRYIDFCLNLMSVTQLRLTIATLDRHLCRYSAPSPASSPTFLSCPVGQSGGERDIARLAASPTAPLCVPGKHAVHVSTLSTSASRKGVMRHRSLDDSFDVFRAARQVRQTIPASSILPCT